jgi:hypothetical protein
VKDVHGRVFRTAKLLQIAGCTRRQLETAENHGLVAPAVKGHARGQYSNRYSFTTMLAIAFGRKVKAAGFDRRAVSSATVWVAAQDPARLLRAFQAGKTVLLPYAEAPPVLIEAALPPDTRRELRLLLSQLDLARCFRQVEAKAKALAKGGR